MDVPRVAKSGDRLLADLESQVKFLREAVGGLATEPDRYKLVAAGLRVLVFGRRSPLRGLTLGSSLGSWMMNVSIRLEEPHDMADVLETNEQAFGTRLEARLVDKLRASPDSISVVATADGRVVGHILFTPVTIEPPLNVRVAGLAPMSVRPECQREGVGTQLVRAGLEECRRNGYAAVVLVGHPGYYARFGFVPAHRKGLECEFAVPQEAFMVLELDPDALRGVVGLVRYRPEFTEEQRAETSDP